MAEELRCRLMLSRDQNALAAEHFKHLYFLFAVPSVIMASLIGVIEVVVPGDGPWRRMIVAVVSAANTCLLTISNMYSFQSVKDQHNSAAKMYSSLLIEFDYSVWFPGQQSPENMAKALENFLGHAEKRINELDGHVPPVPLWIIEQVQDKRRRSEANRFGVVDPNMTRLLNLIDFGPVLGAASVAMHELLRFRRPGEEQVTYHFAIANALYAIQLVIFLGLSESSRNGHRSRNPSACSSIYAMLFGSSGVAAMLMMTWSCVELARGDLWTLAFVGTQALALFFDFAQPRRPQCSSRDQEAYRGMQAAGEV